MAHKNPAFCFFHALKVAVTNHKGTGHKVAHNITTLLNIPLVGWLICSIFQLRGADHAAFIGWLSTPLNTAFAAAFILVTLTHFTLEIEVVLEDYISDLKARHLAINLLKGFFIVLGLATLISILKVGL